MKNLKYLKFINPLLFISFLIQFITFILFETLLGGVTAYKIHRLNGYVLSILVVSHIILNMPMYLNMLKQSFKKKKTSISEEKAE